MKITQLLTVAVAATIVFIACKKESSLDNHAESYGKMKHDSPYRVKKDTCIRTNGKDSCFKIYFPSDTVSHNVPHTDTIYYPGGGKDTCVKRNGRDSCYKWPVPADSSKKKNLFAGR